jgi:hypothetical protein
MRARKGLQLQLSDFVERELSTPRTVPQLPSTSILHNKCSVRNRRQLQGKSTHLAPRDEIPLAEREDYSNAENGGGR